MNLSLPDAKKLISIFLFLVIVAGSYFLGIKKPNDNKSMEKSNNESNKISNAFFIPPNSTTEEVKVRGRVVIAENGEFSGATHKVIDSSGKTIIYAFTEDDKLKQQEQSVVTLVGKVPLGTVVSPKALLKVDYISFK